MRFASCKPSAYKENENKEQREFILDHIWGTSTKRDLEEREWKYAGITEGNWVERRGKSAFRFIWRREGKATLSEDHVHQGKQAEKEADSCESLMCPRSEGQLKIVYTAQEGVGRREN